MSVPNLIYKAAYSHAPGMQVLISKDIDEAGELWAVQIIKALQFFMQRLPQEAPIAVHFCTGDTPWIGYRKLVDWCDKWDSAEVRAVLHRYGIDSDHKPDMKRIIAFPLDAIFPQKRNAYYAFANILNILFENLHIPEANRHLFYGDIIMDDTGKVRTMSDDEFSSLMQDVEQNGILLDEFHAHKLGKDIQYRHLKAMQHHAREMTVKIEELNGAHIFLSGVGPSYDGKGHVGFMEAGTSFAQKAFVSPAGYFVTAGHAKENGGIATMYTRDKKAMYGFITFGFYEVLYRQRNRDRQIVIVMATTNNKAESVRRFIEEEASTEYPLTGLQQSTGAIILDQGSAYRLKFLTNPWDFDTISDWTPQWVRKFFVQTSKDRGKPVHKLEPKDFLHLVPTGCHGRISSLIRDIRRENLRLLTAEHFWQYHRDQVSTELADKLVFADKVSEKLKLARESHILIINPHLDDEYLGLQRVIHEFTRDGHKVHTYYLAKGYTAVHDSFIFAILERIKRFTKNEIQDCPTYEEIVAQLSRLRSNRNNPLNDAMNFEPWYCMAEEEQLLMAQSLFVQLNKYLKHERGVDVDSVQKLGALVDFLTGVTKTKPFWGGVDLEIMSHIKTWTRVTETSAALMSLGLRFSEVHPPLDVTWYSSFGRGYTANQSDIEQVKHLIESHKPALLITNGEGFPDYGAHSTTEVSTYLALAELHHEGKLELSSLKYLQYAGVWERIPAQDADLSVVLAEAEMAEFSRGFRNFYASQAPAPVPDSGTNTINFFSDQVCENARVTKEEISLLLGSHIPSEFQPILCNPLGGVLNYKLVQLNSPQFLSMVAHKREELERVRKAKEKSSSKTFQGDAPKPSIKDFEKLYYSEDIKHM
jgi:6-phosphogluconolactonase/glucosamine-6-phosphate isomerase/deaminase